MNLAQHLITLSLRAYQLAVSPVLHFVAGPLGGCRFTPTCSVYAAQAVREHGVARGAALTVGRLCRCHPWGGCGHDPVPGVANQYSVLSAQCSVGRAKPGFGQIIFLHGS